MWALQACVCLFAGWFVYPDSKVTDACDLMLATRDIEAGEEITFGMCSLGDVAFQMACLKLASSVGVLILPNI